MDTKLKIAIQSTNSGWKKAIQKPVCPGSNGSVTSTRLQPFKIGTTRVVYITDDRLGSLEKSFLIERLNRCQLSSNNSGCCVDDSLKSSFVLGSDISIPDNDTFS